MNPIRVIAYYFVVFMAFDLAAPALAGKAAPDPLPMAIRAALAASPEGVVPARPAVGMTLDEAARRLYGARDFRPIWTTGAMADQLLSGLKGMTEDGLDPEDYGLSRLIAARAVIGDLHADPARRAAVDVLATRAYIHALFHLHRGKLDPIDFAPRPVDAAAGLTRIVDKLQAGDVLAAFAEARPQSKLYAALRDGLKAMRQVAAKGGWPVVPNGPTLKLGINDPRVHALRQRLAAEGYLPPAAADDGNFDATLEDAVKRFQNDYYLEPDGLVGGKTLAALNVSAIARAEQIRVNLERARQLMGVAQGDFVVVDIAGYRVSFYRDGQAIWRSRVVVGRPYRQTPEFKSAITSITLNPDWTVPPSIFSKDMVPKIRRNLNYLAENHLRVLDGQGREIAPASVNWSNPRGIMLRQQAGPWNALGRVVIRFANHYAVYLHDTPYQELFDKAQRDFSSGCIRVEEPFELVYRLFNADDDAARAVIDEGVASGETLKIPLPKPVPILLIYWTTDVRDDGRVMFKPDIYGRDAQILARLNVRTML